MADKKPAAKILIYEVAAKEQYRRDAKEAMAAKVKRILKRGTNDRGGS